MQRFWSWMAVRLGRHAGLVAVIGLVFTIVIGLGITRLEFATGQDSYLNKGSQTYVDNVDYQNLFGGQAMLSVIAMDDGATVDELFTSDGIATMKSVEKRLDESGAPLGVVSPLTALTLSDRLVASDSGNPADSIAGKAILNAAEAETDSDAKAERLADAGTTLQRTAAVPIEQRTLDNPEWVKFLLYDNQGEVRSALRSVFPDDTHAQMVVRLHGNLSIEDEGAAATTVQDIASGLEFDNAEVTTTGASILLKDINDYLRGGMLTLGGIAVAMMIVILMLFFHVRWRLLPLAVVIIGVIWAFGLAGYIGIPLTLVTIAGLPVMLGIGIDYAIQMHSRIEEEVIIAEEPHPIQAAARGLGPALLVVTFDAVFAFGAIQISKVPMVREFGWLLVVGIIAICVSSIINPLAALGIREFKSPTKGRDFSEGRLGRIVVWLGSLPGSMAIVLSVLAVVVFVVGSVLEPKLKLDTDPVNWVDQDSKVIRDIRTIEREIGGASDMGVFITADDTSGTDGVFTDGYVKYVDTLAMETMKEYSDELLVDSSIVGTVRKLTDVPGTPSIAPPADLVSQAWDVAPKGIQVSTASSDGNAFNLIFLTRAGSLENQATVVDALRTDADPPDGLSVTPSGLAVVGVGLLENLEANLVELTWLAIGLVFLFLVVRLRSLVRALLSMVPVLIASGLATIAIYLLDIELSPMTAVGGPLVVATCTEFTSLILLRYLEERRRGLEPRAAIDVTAARTGRAFIVSAMTAIAGVAVIAFSSLPLLSNFGVFVALKIAIALLAALVVLPPMIVWADKWNLVSKGMLDHEEAPYIEVPDRGPTSETTHRSTVAPRRHDVDLRLDNKVALVTGASRGIGRATAVSFAAAGASVMLSSRKEDALREAMSQISTSGDAELDVYAANAGDPEAAAACVAATIERFGRLDILVNNAATNPYLGPMIDIDLPRLDKTHDVNLRGPFVWIQQAWQQWMSDNGGNIINLSSIGGLTVETSIGHYNVTKAALIHLTKSLAKDLSPGVRVNAICPGLVKTDMARALWESNEEAVAQMVPLGRLGEPDDIADAALFLASEMSSWITGTTLVVDGGMLLG